MLLTPALVGTWPADAGAQVDSPPQVVVAPGSTGTSQPALSVTITASDDVGLADTTFRVYVNGVEVTPSFVYGTSYRAGPLPYRAGASGIVTLAQTGETTVSARICDTASPRQCTTRDASYSIDRPGVAVTPDAGTARVAAGAGGSYAFGVRNTGTRSATFRLTAECRNAETGVPVASGCTAPATLGPVAAGALATVQVGFPAAAGIPLTVSLAAELDGGPGVRDAGWADVEVTGPGGASGAPQVRVVDLNSGAQLERSQCVTVSAGAGAAYECGDLRLVHPLPATRTYGKSRGPVLIYNSQHAHPMPTVYADVTLPANVGAPQQVRATVTLTGGATYTRTFNGGDWAPGTTRRIAVQWDGVETPTGVYGYTLQVTNVYGTAAHSAQAVAGEIAVVNRSASPYGAGWWMAGLEELQYRQSDGSFLWIGGDGSTRRYFWVANGAWRSSGVGRPDTLWGYGSSEGSYFWRRLPGGAQVWFDPSLRHAFTMNPLGHRTWFRYRPDLPRHLDRIVAPVPAGSDSVYYAFAYGQFTGRLMAVDAPGVPGVTWGRRYVTLFGAAAVDSIRDPDGTVVRFGQDPARAYRVASRTDRRGVQTVFSYDGGGRLDTAMVTLENGTPIVSGFQSAEGRGVATTVASSRAYTLLDGPRSDVTDHTWLWLTRWGAPRRIRDALGGETLITRGDAALPALPTEVTGPGGLTTTAQYDARGRLVRTTAMNPLGDGYNPAVTYAYDDLWDRPDTIRAEGVGETRLAYDAANGNVLWQEVGDATRRVHFDYYPSGQLMRVRYPDPVTGAPGGGGADSLAYDAMGNLSLARTPMRFLTLHYRDALGRDTLTVTPTDSVNARSVAGVLATGVRQRTEYDAMDRPRVTETLGPAITHPTSTDTRTAFTPAPTPQERLRVETTYDAGGLVTDVVRRMWPDPGNIGPVTTHYDYDWAGRLWQQTGSQGATRAYVLDPAGNAVEAHVGSNPVISMQYDALGRLVRRTVPGVTHLREYAQIGLLQHEPPVPFPRFPNGAAGRYVISAEDTWYRYDAAGNQVYAENGDAIVRRAYHRSGVLRGDTLVLRSYAGGFGQSYGLEFAYDSAGRVKSMQHPQNLAGAANLDRYRYDPVTGALAQVTARQGELFQFEYDRLGRPTVTHMPGSVRDTTGYDLDGRMTWHRSGGPGTGGYLLNETLRYDGRGKVVRAENFASVFQQWYSGIGNLVATDWQAVGTLNRYMEESVIDPLGNVVRQYKGDGLTPIGAPGNHPHYKAYEPGQARVIAMAYVPPSPNPGSDFRQDSTAQWYDQAGNLQGSYGAARESGAGRESQSRHFYGADDRLRAVQRVAVRQRDEEYSPRFSGVWEEYRYDPLGRRILVRTRTDGGLCDADPWLCTSSITRFVWAGDQILWELRAPGNEGANLEATTASGNAYGQVSYTHAGGIDRPLVITRNGLSVIPHQNWRGMFALGTNPAGGRDVPDIDWPGFHTTPWHGATRVVENWFGSLATEMRDATGQIYRRNRYYDPASGQFTQPDPIGLAGGLNSYGFAEGDPVSYSDPYGLKVCLAGSRAEVGAMKTALEGATGATVSLDKQNCISEVGASSDRRLRGLRDRLNFLNQRANTYTVGFTGSAEFKGSMCSNLGSHFCPDDLVVEVDPGDVHGRTDPAAYFGCSLIGAAEIGPMVGHSGESIISHELLGHAWANEAGLDIWSERTAIRAENVFRGRGGGRERCGG